MKRILAIIATSLILVSTFAAPSSAASTQTIGPFSSASVCQSNVNLYVKNGWNIIRPCYATRWGYYFIVPA